MLCLSVLLSAQVFASDFLNEDEFVDAPYSCTILKERSRTRFRDFVTSGRFLIYKIEFQNQDNIPHTIDLSCFYLTDTNGAKYDVHPLATSVKQGELADINPLRDIDNWVINAKTIHPQFKLSGWLVFEVPAKGDYQIGFRGYLK